MSRTNAIKEKLIKDSQLTPQERMAKNAVALLQGGHLTDVYKNLVANGVS